MDSIITHLQQHALQRSTAVAMLGLGRPALTYAELWQRIRDWQTALQSADVQPGDRVAVILPDSEDAAVAILGIASLTACAPLNPASTERQFVQAFEALHADVLIASAGLDSTAVAAAQSAGLRVIEVEFASGGGIGAFAFRSDPTRPSRRPTSVPIDAALLLFTSGTSARPKLVPLMHANLGAAAESICAALQLTPHDRCLAAMPLYHIHGLSTLFASIVAGGSFIGMTTFAPDRFYEAMRSMRPTWYSASPTLHRISLEQIALLGTDPRESGLRFIRSASAPMPTLLIREMERAFGVPFIEAYGMTEAGPQIASNRLPPFVRKPGSVGRAAGPEIAILDAAGRELPAGETGEVAIRGPNVTAGDLDNAEANDAAHANGWLRTGDAGRLDDEQYLFITGRLKDIINRGGEKISPARVDEALLRHPLVAQAATFAVPHAVLGENVAAAVVLNSAAADPPSLKIEILEFVTKELSAFEVPHDLMFVNAIPLSAAGKLVRSNLPAALGWKGGASSPPVTASVLTPTQLRIARVFAEVLKIDLAGPFDDFFALGGHSLAAMQVVSRLSEIFGVSLPPDVLFRLPTVAQLARAIGDRMADLAAESSESSKTHSTRIPRRRPDAPAPLSFSQERLFFIDQMGVGSAYNMSASLRLKGNLDLAALSRSVNEIVHRHESLRTTFDLAGEHPVQQITQHVAVDLPFTDVSHSTDAEAALHQLASQALSEPFDLKSGPIFRAALVRVAPDAHVLLMHLHHIVSDGWSVGVLHEELRTLYTAFANGHESSLAPLAIQLADFARWERERLSEADFTAGVRYWTKKLAGTPPVCTFPPDRVRPPVQTSRGGTHESQLSKAVIDRLRAVSEAEQVTPFMTMLAAFQTLLHRLNGQDDIVVGAPIANRSMKELEPLIGFFANTLVIRNSLAGDPTFVDLLERVRTTAVAAFEHQEVPLERIASELHAVRDPSYTPLFQVMFAYQNLPAAAASVASATPIAMTPYRVPNASTKFDLTLYLRPDADGGITATWQYNADLFDAASVERFSAMFAQMLESVAADPRRPISQLSLLSTAERRQLEIEWNRTNTRRVHRRNFLELFDAQVGRSPDSTAVVSGEAALTYRTLDRRASVIAARLRDAGVRAGMLLGVCLPRSADQVAVLLGVWKTGAAFLPLDPNYPAERTAHMLADAQASFIVTERSLRARFAEKSDRPLHTVCVDELLREADDEPLTIAAEPFDPEALAYVIYTSGSSGRPKGVMITQGNVCHYAQAIGDAIGLRESDRYLHSASFAFSSSIRQLTAPLACGAAIVIAPAETTHDPEMLFELVRREHVTTIDLVPSLWASALGVMTSLESARRETLLDNALRLALSASEPLPIRVANAWRELLKSGVTQINLFGQTETTGIVTSYTLPDLPDSTAAVPIGKPIANTQIYVLDAAMRLVPTGVVGEIYVGGAGVGRGYIGQAELTAERFVANPFSVHPGNRLYRTGDLARYGADGVLEFVGRSDGQLKVRGFRIEPAEIESVLASHPRVRECAVASTQDASAADGGIARIVAFVTPRGVDCVALRDFLKQRLPEYMVPSEFRSRDDLLRTPNGKLDRAAMLAAPDVCASSHTKNGADDTTMPIAAPELAQAQVILTEVWKAVLHRTHVGLDENFFDLGGNSLLSVNIVVRAKQAGLHVTLAQLYQNQTIAELARAICHDQPAIAPVRTGTTLNGKHAHETSVAVTARSLRAYGIEALTKAGLSLEGAEIVTEVQLEASLRGQPTHNIVSIPRYAKRLSVGKINARPNIRIEGETAISARLDGDNGPGQWVATVAMELAIKKAREAGIGMVAVRRSNHFGAAGQYVWQAVQDGLIGLCTTNGPVILAPTGGVTPTFGNNPIGVGIPAGRHFPILLDIAISVAPRGRIGLAVAEGKPLPAGWILDRHGRPSTDLADLAAGLGVPIGGHKGYGLALVMEVLSGVLTGAGFCADHHRDKLHGNTAAPDYGHFFMAIDPQLFMPAAAFTERVDHLITQTKGGPLAHGADEIVIPGEIELRARARSLEEGVLLRPSIVRTLLSYAKDARLTTTLEMIDSPARPIGANA